ncbi:MAG: hypothetical protein NC307_10885 [Roseburia sp.]|nr:hypothetical protein [Roseburia sp.]
MHADDFGIVFWITKRDYLNWDSPSFFGIMVMKMVVLAVVLFPTVFGYIYNKNIDGGNMMFRIDKTFARANIAKTIRFTEELNSTLTALANGEDISFNELVLRCCQYAIDHYDGDVDLGSIQEEDE